MPVKKADVNEIQFVDDNSEDAVAAVAVREGQFARVKSGKHEGRYGVVQNFVDKDKEGVPRKATLRTRDDNQEILTVKLNELERAEAGGR